MSEVGSDWLILCSGATGVEEGNGTIFDIEKEGGEHINVDVLIKRLLQLALSSDTVQVGGDFLDASLPGNEKLGAERVFER